MNKIVHIVLFALIALSITTSSVFAENICYKANKKDFHQTPGMPHDVIFDLRDLKKKQWIYLSFLSLLPIPYADSEYSFDCMPKENKPESYECVGDCDSGRMQIRVEDEYLYVNVTFATMTNTPDDPIMHKIRSKENKFTSAYRTVCPKSHTFQRKQETHLPYVCYNWKGKEHVEGSNKIVYAGCTQHNQACKSIGAQHFGKYPNDYESYKALQRCGDATPNLVPKTSSSLKSQTFVKSKNRKKELLDSITIKDVDIHDLDYYNDLVIAVGEDDSPRIRKLRSMEEYYESVIIRSLDGGKSWHKIREGEEDSVPHNTVIILDDKRIVVASSMEGPGGSIILSEDAGKSWETRYNYAFIESMKHIKGDTIVAKTFGPTIKSIDGGKNWVDIPSQ